MDDLAQRVAALRQRLAVDGGVPASAFTPSGWIDHIGAAGSMPGPLPPLPLTDHPFQPETIALISHAIGNDAALGIALARDGHRVTLVPLGPAPVEIQQACAAAGVTVAPMGFEHALNITGTAPRQAYSFHQWLKSQRFDVVRMGLGGGLGFFAMAAKALGLAHTGTAFVLALEPTTEQLLATARRSLTTWEDLQRVTLERSCLVLADLVWSTRADAADWLITQDWPLLAARLAHVPDPELWRRWHGRRESIVPSPPSGPLPQIAVCIPHHNRTRLLRQALDSVVAQSYQPVEVIVVDDGSDDPAEIAALAEIEAWLTARGWRLVRQANAYAGAARNRAVAEATAPFIFFLDDDDILLPTALETVARASVAGQADIVTLGLATFESADEPHAGTPVGMFYTPPGVGLATAIAENMFGPISALIRRETFLGLGGFTTDRGVGNEDFEFFVRAALAGVRLWAVPEILLWYRQSAGGVHSSTGRAANMVRTLRPVREAMPPWVGLALDYACGLTQAVFIKPNG